MSAHVRTPACAHPTQHAQDLHNHLGIDSPAAVSPRPSYKWKPGHRAGKSGREGGVDVHPLSSLMSSFLKTSTSHTDIPANDEKREHGTFDREKEHLRDQVAGLHEQVMELTIEKFTEQRPISAKTSGAINQTIHTSIALSIQVMALQLQVEEKTAQNRQLTRQASVLETALTRGIA